MVCGIFHVYFAAATSLSHLDCQGTARVYNFNMYDNTNKVIRRFFSQKIMYSVSILMEIMQLGQCLVALSPSILRPHTLFSNKRTFSYLISQLEEVHTNTPIGLPNQCPYSTLWSIHILPAQYRGGQNPPVQFCLGMI